MKLFVLLLVCVMTAPAHAQVPTDEPLRIISIFAHPDDADSKMGATAAMMADMGHKVKFVSITNGNAGHFEEGGGVLGQRRRAESQDAADELGIDSYKVLDYHDAELEPHLHIRKDVIREIRKWEADVVLGLRPNDYHPDHRYAGVLVMDAAYMVIVPNTVTDTPALERNPVFLFMQDRFKRPYPFQKDVVVGFDEEYMDRKMRGLAAHESQMFEWLPWVAGTLEEVPDGEEERLEWLYEWRSQRDRIDGEEEIIEGLNKWYGEDQASDFDYAEFFEIAEYGHQPSEEELRMIFPMLEPSE